LAIAELDPAYASAFEFYNSPKPILFKIHLLLVDYTYRNNNKNKPLFSRQDTNRGTHLQSACGDSFESPPSTDGAPCSMNEKDGQNIMIGGPVAKQLTQPEVLVTWHHGYFDPGD